MTVNVLAKMDQWRTWKADVEDYTEETLPGIRGYLEKTKEGDEEIEEVDVDPVAWDQREMRWRFLKRYTADDARKVVSSVSDRNGWEAWRKLHLQFEPALVMREAVVMAQFTSMVNKRAKTPADTKTLLVELDERAKRVEEITGERIENRHMMSVVMGVLDSESMKHTAQCQGAKVRADVLKRKMVEFANLTATGKSGPDSMDIGRVEAKTKRADQVDEWYEDEGSRKKRCSYQQWVQSVTSAAGSDTTHQTVQAKGLVLEKMAVAKAKAKATKATKAARALETRKVERVSVVRVSETMGNVRMAKEKAKRQ